MNEIRLDGRDLKILQILREDSKKSLREISREVKLSASSVRNRIQRLVELGVIKKFTVDIDYRKIGYDIQVLVQITSKPGKSQEIYQCLCELQQVHKVFWTAGPTNFVCLVRVHNMGELSEFITQKLEKYEGIESIESMFVMPNPEC